MAANIIKPCVTGAPLKQCAKENKGAGETRRKTPKKRNSPKPARIRKPHFFQVFHRRAHCQLRRRLDFCACQPAIVRLAQSTVNLVFRRRLYLHADPSRDLAKQLRKGQEKVETAKPQMSQQKSGPKITEHSRTKIVVQTQYSLTSQFTTNFCLPTRYQLPSKTSIAQPKTSILPSRPLPALRVCGPARRLFWRQA